MTVFVLVDVEVSVVSGPANEYVVDVYVGGVNDSTGRIVVSVGSPGMTVAVVVNVTNAVPVGVLPLIQTVLPDGLTV